MTDTIHEPPYVVFILEAERDFKDGNFTDNSEFRIQYDVTLN